MDDQLRETRLRETPIDSLVDWQWGGWIEYYAFHFDDGIQSSRFLQRPGTSVWTRLRLDDGAHEIFARVRLTYNNFANGDEYTLNEDWVGPNIDRLWYQVDVGKALRLTQPADPIQLGISVGRRETQFGTGYAFDLPTDGVMFDLKLYDWRVQGLWTKSIPSYPNIDRSFPVSDHSARRFYGVQVQYEGIPQHVPFAYALWNDDFIDERPKDRFQNYSYDTSYFGIGSKGEIVHNLNYWLEGVWESGKSYGDGMVREQDNVSAWGLDVGMEYLFDLPTRPRVMAEYMFASGDNDRTFSATNAAGGNRSGLDTGFNAFGFRDTGIAAQLQPTNLHIVKVGGSFVPFEQVAALRDLELGTNWFYYHKHQSAGAISDPTADEFEGNVGWEMDYYLNWRLASDLSWTVRWGTFFPGNAYSDDDSRHMIFSGVTWSF